MIAFKKSVLKILAVVALGAVAASVFASGPSLTKEQKAQIKEMKTLHGVDNDWMTYYNKGKVDKVVALYADDATLMPPDAPVASGKAAIKAFFAGDIAASQKAGYKFNITGTPDGVVTGDWGWVSGTYTVTDKAGNIVDAGKYLSISHRVKGKWYYVRDSWNSDGGIPQVPGSGN
ncbi:MAG: YybH family protein [Bacillota bacterium]